MRKKIIEVSSDTNIGGAGKCLMTLLKNFDYDKYDVSVVLPFNSLLKPEILKLGIRVIEADGIADKSLSRKGIGELKKIIRAEHPDLVHTHASMSARFASKLCRTKIVYTRHSVFEPPAKISHGIGKILNGSINNLTADGIIAVAEAAKDNLTATGVDPDKIRVVLNGVDALTSVSDTEKEKIRRRFGITDKEKVVSIIARLEDIKGHEYFIDAAADLLKKGINAKFFIAGTGSYENVLKEKVASLGINDKVIFTGFINDVDKLLNVTDVQVNASYGTEATSLALLEGMSLGIPAVVSDFGGNPGVIANGKNGFVVKKQNASLIAEKLGVLLSDDNIYKLMSENSRTIFNEKFTSKQMTINTEKVYDDVLGGNKFIGRE